MILFKEMQLGFFFFLNRATENQHCLDLPFSVAQYILYVFSCIHGIDCITRACKPNVKYAMLIWFHILYNCLTLINQAILIAILSLLKSTELIPEWVWFIYPERSNQWAKVSTRHLWPHKLQTYIWDEIKKPTKLVVCCLNNLWKNLQACFLKIHLPVLKHKLPLGRS